MNLINGDCLQIMKTLDDDSIDLIATDPPYFKVKGEAWDNQWDTAEGFLSWMGELCDQWHRILKPNGSLYVFASPKMAAHVEVEIGRRFNVLNNIRWIKEAGWHKKNKKEELRSYLSPHEAVLFAEHYNSDNIAKGEAGYLAKCDELRGFVFEPLRAYLDGERIRAGLSVQGVADLCGWKETKASHYFNNKKSPDWFRFITEESYKQLREKTNNGEMKFFKKEYKELRRDYEELRKEYEELRRPFNATPETPYTDVWTFKTVSTYKGKHPCEKPLEMMRHIVRMSSREGATVLDCFMGTGVTGEACQIEGREFIGIEKSEKYFKRAEARLKAQPALL